MLYNIFETEQEAINAEMIDYEMHMEQHQIPYAYMEKTTSWAIPQQRLDGKWVYPLCPCGIQTHIKEEYNQEWFYVGEDM